MALTIACRLSSSCKYCIFRVTWGYSSGTDLRSEVSNYKGSKMHSPWGPSSEGRAVRWWLPLCHSCQQNPNLHWPKVRNIKNYRRLISRTLLMNRHPIMVSSLYLSSAHSKESSTIVIRAENSFIEGIHSLEGKIKWSRLLEKNQKRLQDWTLIFSWVPRNLVCTVLFSVGCHCPEGWKRYQEGSGW